MSAAVVHLPVVDDAEALDLQRPRTRGDCAGGGVVAVLAAGAFGWVVTLAEERRMRVPTSGCAGVGHRGGAQHDRAQVTAREAGTP